MGVEYMFAVIAMISSPLVRRLIIKQNGAVQHVDNQAIENVRICDHSVTTEQFHKTLNQLSH